MFAAFARFLLALSYGILLALASPQDKTDSELRAILWRSDPSELIGIIVVFQEKPSEGQINVLKALHSMEITYVHRIINTVAGKAPAGNILVKAEYGWVKEIWLDKNVFAVPNHTVKTSDLIGTLQEENEKLNQTISNLYQEVGEL